MNGPEQLIVTSEIVSLRKLTLLMTSIILAVLLINLGTHAFRIYLIDKHMRPMQAELDQLHKELDYVCHHARADSQVQCRLRSASQQLMDSADGNGA